MTRDPRDTENPAGQRARRFRVTRRAPLRRRSGEDRALRDPAEVEDDADRGTPEQDAALSAGCMSMIWVAGFFFVVMILSIIVTMLLP